MGALSNGRYEFISAKNKKQAQKLMPWAVIVERVDVGFWAGFSDMLDYEAYKRGVQDKEAYKIRGRKSNA